MLFKTRMLLLALLFISIASCSDDTVTVNQGTPSPYKNLTAKDDVLFNLELSYNERNLDEYEKLLDQDFIFYFAHSDYLEGKTPESWNRTDELLVTKYILNHYADSTAVHHPSIGDAPRRNDAATEEFTWGEVKALPVVSKSLSLNLTYLEGDSNWTSGAPPGVSVSGAEEWYSKQVVVDLTLVDFYGRNYYVIDNSSRFYIRQTLAGGHNVWQIIRWDDLGMNR